MKYFKVTNVTTAITHLKQFEGKYFIMDDSQITAAEGGAVVECPEMNIHTLEPVKGDTCYLTIRIVKGKYICPILNVIIEEIDFKDLLFPEQDSEVYSVLSARISELLFSEDDLEPEPVKPTSAADILNVVAETIGDRSAERDTEAERSMKSCIDAFNAMYGHQLSETQGWMFMAMLKMSRAKSGKFRADDWVDLVGYTALASECEFAQHNKLESAK